MASTTGDEIQKRLDAHPELVDRLRAGDVDAFTELLQVVGGAKVDSAAVAAVWDEHRQFLAWRGIHKPDLDNPMSHPEALADSYRFVIESAKNPRVQKILAREPVPGKPISRAEFHAKYAKYLDD